MKRVRDHPRRGQSGAAALLGRRWTPDFRGLAAGLAGFGVGGYPGLAILRRPSRGKLSEALEQ